MFSKGAEQSGVPILDERHDRVGGRQLRRSLPRVVFVVETVQRGVGRSRKVSGVLRELSRCRPLLGVGLCASMSLRVQGGREESDCSGKGARWRPQTGVGAFDGPLRQETSLWPRSEHLVKSVKVGAPLVAGDPEGDGEGLSLVTYWPNK